MRWGPPLVALLLAGVLVGSVQGAQTTFSGQNGKILVIAARGGGNQLFGTTSAQKTASQLTKFSADVEWPQASANGSKIVFDRCSSQTACDVWVMNSDGTKSRALTHGGQSFGPAWSKDGTRIAFWRCSGGCTLSVVKATGGAVRSLAGGTGPEDLGRGLSWSPSGKTIAFSRTDSTTGPIASPAADIFTVSSTGGAPKQLTNTPDANDVNPLYSPNGKKIVWELRDHENPHPDGCSQSEPKNESQEIWEMNANGAGPRALTSHGPPCDFSPQWSPNGQKILFAQSNAAIRTAPGQVALATMNPDGGNQKVLVPTTLAPFNEVWSPSSASVAFVGFTPTGVFVVPAAGGKPARIRSAPGGSSVQDWATVPVCKKGQKSTAAKPCRKA